MFQHMLEGLCEEVYDVRKKEFLYKRDVQGRLVTEMCGMRLVDRDVGAAIRTFRVKQMKSSKFPLEFWA